MPSYRQTALILFSGVVLPAWLPSCDCSKTNEDTGEPTQPTLCEDPDPTWDRGEWLSMAAMPDGNPVMAFYNRTKGGLEVAIGEMLGEQTRWCYEQVDGFADSSGMDTGDRGKYATVAVDPSGSGTVWVAYQDATNRNLRYAKRTTTLKLGGAPGTELLETTWETGMADTGGGATPDAGSYASLAIDANGNPVVAHYDKGKGELRVAHWNGTGFTGESVDAGSDATADDGSTIPADVGAFSHLYVDSSGTEYIAYYDAAWGRLLLAVGSTGAYTTYTVDDSGDVGQWPSIWLDGDTIHISYHDVGNQDLKHAYGKAGSFKVETVDDGEYAGADSEIFAFGSYPGILYFSGQDNDMKLATYDGSSWKTTTVAGDGAALGFHIEVTEIGGKHYAACYDYTNRNIWFSTID